MPNREGSHTCPVCKQKLQEGDELVAQWYAPMNWFVVYHVKSENVPGFFNNLAGDGPAIEFTHCGEAGFQLRREVDNRKEVE